MARLTSAEEVGETKKNQKKEGGSKTKKQPPLTPPAYTDAHLTRGNGSNGTCTGRDDGGVLVSKICEAADVPVHAARHEAATQ